jgi:hypothetical protein
MASPHTVEEKMVDHDVSAGASLSVQDTEAL